MALRGNLKDFSLPDVFQLVTFSRKSGVLRIRRSDHAEGSVWFRDGDVFFAQSNWHAELLGERLVRAQRLTPQALDRALSLRAAEPEGGRRLGEILVDESYITDKVLEVFVSEQIQETIFDLMRWDEGEFDFEATPQIADEDIGLSVSIENIIMEGSRRLEEWARIRKKIPSMDVVFKMATAPGEGTFEISLKPTEWNLLLLVDGTRSVSGLAEATNRTDFEVARVIYGLFSAGLLEFAADDEVERLRAERIEREARLAKIEEARREEDAAEAQAAQAREADLQAEAEARAECETPVGAAAPESEAEAGAFGAVSTSPVAAPPSDVPQFLSAAGTAPTAQDDEVLAEMMGAVLRPAPVELAPKTKRAPEAAPEETPPARAPEAELKPEPETAQEPQVAIEPEPEAAAPPTPGPEVAAEPDAAAPPTPEPGLEPAPAAEPASRAPSQAARVPAAERTTEAEFRLPAEPAPTPSPAPAPEPISSNAEVPGQGIYETVVVEAPESATPKPAVAIESTAESLAEAPGPEPPVAPEELVFLPVPAVSDLAASVSGASGPLSPITPSDNDTLAQIQASLAGLAEPKPAPAVEPAPEPAPAVEPAPEPAPAVEPAPEPVAEVAPELEPVSELIPEPQPTVEAAAATELEPAAEPAPEPAVAPEPAPVLEPVAESVSSAQAPKESTPEPVAEIAPAASTSDFAHDLMALGLGELPAELTAPDAGIVVPPRDAAGSTTVAAPAGWVDEAVEPLGAAPQASIESEQFAQLADSMKLSGQTDGGDGSEVLEDTPDFTDLLGSLDYDAVTKGDSLYEAMPGSAFDFDEELLRDTASSGGAGVISTDAFLGDISGDPDFSGGLTDELSALTGADRPSRPTASVHRLPDASSGEVLRRDVRVDRETVLRIIDGIKNL